MQDELDNTISDNVLLLWSLLVDLELMLSVITVCHGGHYLSVLVSVSVVVHHQLTLTLTAETR